jgi:hypothetical protein
MKDPKDPISEVLAAREAWLVEWDGPAEGRTVAGEPCTPNMRTQMSVNDAIALQRYALSRLRSRRPVGTEYELLADLVSTHWAKLRPVTRYIVEAYCGDSLAGAECVSLAAAHRYVVGLLVKYESGLDDSDVSDLCAAVGDDDKFQETFMEIHPNLAGQYAWAAAKGAS